MVGDIVEDIRIRHQGDIQAEVIEGACQVLDQFDTVTEHTEAFKALPLNRGEELAFATAALALRFGERTDGDSGEPIAGHIATPITADQLIEPRRPEDHGSSLWIAYQKVQENLMRGGLAGRSAQGRRMQTRPVVSIDRGVSLNRGLWTLAEEMRKLKA